MAAAPHAGRAHDPAPRADRRTAHHRRRARVDDGVVEVMARGAVEVARAGDEPQGPRAPEAVDLLRRELSLGVRRRSLDDDPRHAAVATPDADDVATAQRADPEEDSRTGGRVDVAGDDGGPGLSGSRAAGPPAGLREVIGNVQRPVGVQPDGDNTRAQPDRGDDEADGDTGPP